MRLTRLFSYVTVSIVFRIQNIVTGQIFFIKTQYVNNNIYFSNILKFGQILKTSTYQLMDINGFLDLHIHCL